MKKYLLIVLLCFPGTVGYAGNSGTEQEWSLIREQGRENGRIHITGRRQNLIYSVLYKMYRYKGQVVKNLQYPGKVRVYGEVSPTEMPDPDIAGWQLKYETEKQKSRIAYKILLIIAGISGAATAFIIKNNRRLKHKNEELRLRNEEISKAVHDNLNTKIAALKWRIESAEELTPEQLDIVKLLDDIYEDIRHIAHKL